MQFIRQHIIFKYFWLLMVSFFINTSVDPIDPNGDWVAEDLSVNEMEIIAEQILDIEDCFEETNDDDPDSGTAVKVLKDVTQYIPVKIAAPKLGLVLTDALLTPDYFKRFNSQFIAEINAPPPKLAA
jgi:hypothetical protein